MTQTVSLSPDEIALVRGLSMVAASGRLGLSTTFTSRGLAGWLPPSLPDRLRSERVLGPLLDAMGCERNERTCRRRSDDLLAALPTWTAMADAAEAEARTQGPTLLNFSPVRERDC